MQPVLPAWVRRVPCSFEGAPEALDALRGQAVGVQTAWSLLGPASDSLRPLLLQTATELTRAQFSSIELYAPLYLSNACTNKCSYCGFRYDNPIERVSLDRNATEREAQALAATGIRSVLLLTGEAPRIYGVEPLLASVATARKYFERVAIEVFPMKRRDYVRMVGAGATGITVYQETYDQKRYREVHLAGRKRNFAWRLDAPRRAALAGFEEVGIGALLGLSADWRRECLWLAHHAQALIEEFPQLKMTLSFPRMRDASEGEIPQSEVSDEELVHAMSALRLAFPSVGAVLSTRETRMFRDQFGPAIATKMSAGSSTRPGGYSSGDGALEQFSIADERSPRAVAVMLHEAGIAVRGYERRAGKSALRVI